MADAELAIFLDGNGHVITRNAGEQFPLPPLLRTIVQQLTATKPITDSNSVSEVEMSGVAAAIHSDDGATEELIEEPGRHQRDLAMCWKFVPKGLFAIVFIELVLVALLDRFPGNVLDCPPNKTLY